LLRTEGTESSKDGDDEENKGVIIEFEDPLP
jgi:hypothetical protein